MASDADFDAARIGGALLVLESELRDELFSGAPEQALLRLRQELDDVIRRARAWAERRGVPSRFFPETLAPGAGPEECLALLHDLSTALQFLGSRDQVPDSMSGVVAWLEMHGSAALAELVELSETIREVGSALSALEAAAGAFSTKVAGPALSLNGGGTASASLRAQASEVHDVAIVVLDVFEELERRLAWVPDSPAPGA